MGGYSLILLMAIAFVSMLQFDYRRRHYTPPPRLSRMTFAACHAVEVNEPSFFIHDLILAFLELAYEAIYELFEAPREYHERSFHALEIISDSGLLPAATNKFFTPILHLHIDAKH